MIADARCAAALLLGPLAVIDRISVVISLTLYVPRKLVGVWCSPSWLTAAAATGMPSASEISVVMALTGSCWGLSTSKTVVEAVYLGGFHIEYPPPMIRPTSARAHQSRARRRSADLRNPTLTSPGALPAEESRSSKAASPLKIARRSRKSPSAGRWKVVVCCGSFTI